MHSMRLPAALLLMLSFVSVAPAEVASLPQMSVWYRFERSDEPGRSVGPTPWPAYDYESEVVSEGNRFH